MLMLITAAASARVEPPVPVDVAAEADRRAVDHDLEHAADRVAVRACLVDPRDHRRLGVRVRAAQRRRLGLLACARRAGGIQRHAADLGGERPDLDPQLAQERSRHPARRHPRRRLAGADERSSALRTSLKPYLIEAARSAWPGRTAVIGCARLLPASASAASSAASSSVERADLHHARPVRPVAVLDLEQDRRAKRAAVTDARQDPRPVLLDGLARPAPVPALAAREVDREVVLGQREAGGHALDHGTEHGPVALAGGEEPEPVHPVVSARQSPADPATRRPPRPRRRSGRRRRLALGGAQAVGARIVERLPASRRAAPAGRSTA